MLPWLYCALALCYGAPLSHAQSRSAKKQAMQLQDQHQHCASIAVLESYLSSRPSDAEAIYLLAKAEFECNQLEKAVSHLTTLIASNKKQDPTHVRLLARCYQHQHLFALAISQYKQYLRISEAKRDPTRSWVVNEIKRCASGLAHLRSRENLIVENMGTYVNSPYDDFGPVESPNVPGRVYFSTMRQGKVKDRFDQNGQLVASHQSHDSDMMSTEVVSGAWSTASALNEALNTSQNELLADFSRDGAVAIFQRGAGLDDLRFHVDTFASDTQEPEGTAWQHSPFLADEHVRGVHLFTDSVMIFASDRSGGYGGYDLYLAIRAGQGWQQVENLGPAINSPYDEITPFLTANGRTLYWSNNGLGSMGGFDIFCSTFDEQALGWAPAANLGRPINSAADDIYYRLSTDGLRAYFSSSRKVGKGGQDLYASYFGQAKSSQLERPVPSIFYEIGDFQLFSEGMVDPQRQGEQVSEDLAQFEVPSLIYRADEVVITPQNEKKLEKIVGFLKTYPHVSLEILSHSDQSLVSNFDLFFSMKRAEQVAQYLIEDGVKPSSLYLKGYGGSYPYAKNAIDGRENETGRFFNRRIDFRVHQSDLVPIEVTYDLPEISPAHADVAWPAFHQLRSGLYYRVQFVSLDQLYKGDLIGRYPDPSIEKEPESSEYHYLSGAFKIFEEALHHLGQVKKEGFDHARIIPYLDGLRIDKTAITQELVTNHPDLKNFVLYSN